MYRNIIMVVVVLIIGLGTAYMNRSRIRSFLRPKTKPEIILKKPVTSGNGAVNILFLHHSTGNNIWSGGVKQWFENIQSKKPYHITEQWFPVNYGNNPYDYWNIWVKHAGDSPFQYEPTLEMITKEFDVVVFKHCFPVSSINDEGTKGSADSPVKTIQNYKAQYNALSAKLSEFPRTKFIVWTGAALTKAATSPENAKRAGAFFDWVRTEWDKPGDNIYLWDFQKLETGGGQYLLDNYAVDPADSHPNKTFSEKVAPLFCQRIVDVIEGRGDSGDKTGQQREVPAGNDSDADKLPQ